MALLRTELACRATSAQSRCPNLDAQRYNVSLRYLQMLFAELDTSPARWIRNERLARCHEDLCNPRFDNLTVAENLFREKFTLQAALDGLEPVFAFVAAQGWARPAVHIIDREADSVGHYRAWQQAGYRFLVRADGKGTRVFRELDGVLSQLPVRCGEQADRRHVRAPLGARGRTAQGQYLARAVVRQRTFF